MNTEDIKSLIKLERDMDDGIQPYVVVDGDRCAVPKETMEELDLKSGQTVSKTIFNHILHTNIAHLRTKMALNKAMG